MQSNNSIDSSPFICCAVLLDLQTITVIFDRLDLQTNRNTCHDFVQIYDGSTTDSTVLRPGKICHPRQGTSFTSSGSTLLIQFQTDFSITNTGFHATFRTRNTF